ncbi:MAG: hypothetical protein Hyperionvirus8_15 [Hyperionvirus sp.]|uniref:Uncharacterized protein n=1 Tax=Hyperionvirus sp. TaxID=2487770 RepID=A0A3G5AB97_9VIRU|nr:MAG: hypothetical protein Hyperionvirus8_15 [Hyperionvirus sp.]
MNNFSRISIYMKIYGLFKVINKGNNDMESSELFNLLHPDKKLHRVLNEGISNNKTFFDFFYEDNPYMGMTSIDAQYIEYNKFKRDMEQLINKKNLSMYENDNIGKMVSRLAVAENKYLKYKTQIAGLDKRESENQVIVDELYDMQSKYGKNIEKYADMCREFSEFKDELSLEIKENNFRMLFDLDNVDIFSYDETILYPDSVVAFYRTGVSVKEGCVVIEEAGRVEYVVFELHGDEGVEVERVNTFVEDTIQKISNLCEEIGLEVPEVVRNRVGQRPLRFEYHGRKLVIYRIEENESEVKFKKVTGVGDIPEILDIIE